MTSPRHSVNSAIAQWRPVTVLGQPFTYCNFWGDAMANVKSSSISTQIRHLIDRSVSVLVQPHFYFTSDSDRLDFSEGARYVAVMGFLAGLIGVLTSGAFVSGGGGAGMLLTLALSPVVAVIASFVFAALIQIMGYLGGGTGDYGDSYSVSAAASALAPVTAVFNLLPGIGTLIGLVWGWWVVAHGVSAILGITQQRAKMIVSVFYGVVALLGFFGA